MVSTHHVNAEMRHQQQYREKQFSAVAPTGIFLVVMLQQSMAETGQWLVSFRPLAQKLEGGMKLMEHMREDTERTPKVSSVHLRRLFHVALKACMSMRERHQYRFAILVPASTIFRVGSNIFDLLTQRARFVLEVCLTMRCCLLLTFCGSVFVRMIFQLVHIST